MVRKMLSRCAGLDLLTTGLAKTSMIAAICQGLQAAGVTYTLPPSRDHKGGDDDSAARLRAAEAVAGTSPAAAGSSTTDQRNSDAAAASVAAANVLLMG